MAELLAVEGLTKVFTLHLLGGRKVTACQDISFSVQRGEVLGIMGPSGSGKSTILKCIYRTYLSSGGTALYRSREGTVDLLKATEQTVLALRRREIGYVSQFLQVVPRVSALHVVMEELQLKGWENAAAQAEAGRLLAHLQIPEELWEASPYTFSGGEQQRVNVARAIAKHPRLLLMDEPTASLDLQSKRRVQELILKLKKEGAALIIVSHDQETFRQVADRILYLEHPLKAYPGEVEYHIRQTYN